MKLYEKDSYIKDCTTTVTDCISEDGRIYIKLKDTIFFPEEGGQNSDTGKIVFGDNTVNILCGEITGSGEDDIRYLVDKEIPANTEVNCSLDWNARYDRMQNHSGEHILSGLIHNIYGFDNIGFHLSDDDYVTLTVNGRLNDEQIRDLEFKANKAIYDNLPITDSYPSKDVLQNISYRSKKEIDGQVRLITIGNSESPLDVCACCAPHVKHTGEIGIIKIFTMEYAKGGTRLGILCSRRALTVIGERLNELDLIAKSFSTNVKNIPEMIDKLKNENASLKGKLGELAEVGIINSLNGNDSGCVFTDIDLSPVSMKNIYNLMAEKYDGYVGLFVGSDETGYRYYAGSLKKDSKKLAEKMREELGAKGGGSSEMIQGRIAAGRQEVESFWNSL